MRYRYAQINTPSGGRQVETNAGVVNVIVFDRELTQADLDAWPELLVPADALGLEIGDLYNGEQWTRNVDGMQTPLPIEADSSDVQEMLAILRGEVE